jgi:hypothetical protein
METVTPIRTCRFLAVGPLGMETSGPRTSGMHWNIFWRVDLSHFELHPSHFIVRSCLPFPYRHPWRPPLSSARRPCTRNSSSIIPGQRKRPWRFKPGTHPAKTLRRHRAAASQFKLHRQRKTSSHFKRSTLEHLLTFRRTCDRSTSDKVMFRRL